MKRWIQILVCVFLLTTVGWAQERQPYLVPDFNGGINVVTDGTNLRPNEALEIVNMTLDTIGVLSVRHGFSYLDSAAINTNEEVDAIYIYSPYSGTERMVIATNGNIYITPTISDPGDVDWDTLRMGFTGDSLIVTNASGAAYEIGDLDWWYSKMGLADTIDISGVQYEISSNRQADSIGDLTPVYAASNDTIASYTVYRVTNGVVSFVQQGDKLYICASNQYPLVYDDTSYVYIALIDSGLVTDTTQLTGKLVDAGEGKAWWRTYLNVVYGDSNTSWYESAGVDTGYFFTYRARGTRAGYDEGVHNYEITAEILGIDTSGRYNQLTLDRPNPYITRGDNWNDYEIFSTLTNCVFDSGWGIEDTNKNWLDDVYGTSYLQTFFTIDGEDGYSQTTNPDPSAIRAISCNEKNTFAVVWSDTMTYEIGDHYYVFTRIPRLLNGVDTVSKEFPRFEQIFFYNNQMFGHGKDRWGVDVVNTGNNNRLWYSDFALSRETSILHRYIRYNYSFDVDLIEDVSVKFELRNGAYIGTDKGIWRFGGTPQLFYLGSDLITEKVVVNNGIADLDNWVKATAEYGYFVNITGVYRFDGVRADKISLKIDPIIQKNYGSRIVMGYFPAEQKLFLSFPDSNITYFYDERFGNLDVWIGPWDFGMTCFYAPADTNIFYFGHSEFKGRVYYYPNGLYQDFVAIDDTNDIAISYESGWQSYGGYWTNKRLWDGFYPILGSDTVTIAGYVDFSATPADTNITDQSGRYVYRLFNDNSVTGEYFKIKMSGTVDANFIFGGYRLEWSLAPDLHK